MRPYILAETNLRELSYTEFEVAILPWGATEAHNYHLPYGTDTFETAAFAAEGARLAWELGTRCLVLPVLPFGVNTGQADIPGTLNIYPSTQLKIINDLLESISRSGIRKVLLLNGHGGNDFKPLLREAGSKFKDLFLVTANWYQSVLKDRFFEEPGDHADEMETSLMMHLNPELVRPLDEAGEGKSLNFSAGSINEDWVWSERKWSKVSKDTGIGNPGKSGELKGSDYFRTVSDKIGRLIIEIAELNPENPYK